MFTSIGARVYNRHTKPDDLLKRALGQCVPRHPQLSGVTDYQALERIADQYVKQHDAASARVAFGRALYLRIVKLGTNGPEFAQGLLKLARVSGRNGAELYKQALDILEATAGETPGTGRRSRVLRPEACPRHPATGAARSPARVGDPRHLWRRASV